MDTTLKQKALRHFNVHSDWSFNRQTFMLSAFCIDLKDYNVSLMIGLMLVICGCHLSPTGETLLLAEGFTE